MEEQSFLGLGAKRITLPPNSGIVNTESANIQSSKNGNAAEELVSRYMRQCLDYHHEQVRLEKTGHEQRRQAKEDLKERNNLDVKRENAPLIPLPAPAPNVIPLPITIATTETPSSGPPPLKTDKQFSNDTTHTAEDIQKRIINAKEIAQRFALTAPLSTGLHHTIPPVIGSVTANFASISTPVYPYAQKRKHFLSTAHCPRLHASLLKNLNYLVEKDTELHQRQLQTLQQTMDRSVGLKLHNDRVLSERQSQLRQKGQGQVQKTRKRNRFGEIPKALSGIGTQERKNAQRHNVAVYISGLSVGNSTDKMKQDEVKGSKSDSENVLRQLFGSYGIISRVMLYVDKKTGRQKGDGLVVYDYPKSDGDGNDSGSMNHGHDSFLEMVCSQVCVSPPFPL